MNYSELESTKRLRAMRDKNRNKDKDDEEQGTSYADLESTRRILAARQKNTALQQKRQERESYLDSDRDVSFWDAATTDKTMDDWKQSRVWKKQNQQEIDEAAAQFAAYDQLIEDSKFQRRVNSKSSADIDRELQQYDNQIAEIENSKVGWFEAMAPGGVTPSERKAQKAEADAKIHEIQAQQGKLRQIRDEKKSHEMTDDLPADVKAMLDEFNNLVYEEEGVDWAGVASGFTGSGSGGNAVQRSSADLRIQAIKKELTDRGYDNFIELAEYRKYITDKAAAQEQEERWAQVAEEHPVMASVGARATSVPAAVSGMYGTIKQYENTADFVGGTPYSAYYTPTRARQTIDDTISENFEDGEILSADAKRFLYGAGTSAADSAIASMSGGSLGLGKLTVGETILAVGAANDTLVRASEKGMTQEQAMTTAAVAMASEIIFEHATIGKLSAFESVAEKGIKDIAVNAVKESFVNMTEEMATEVVNLAFDYHYNGGLSDYYQVYEGYIKQGMTEDEAKRAASGDMAMQVVEAGASGALIGAVFSGGQSVTNKVYYNSAMQDIGQSVVDENAVEKELAAASELGISESDDVYRALGEVEEYQRQKADNEAYQGTKKQIRSIGQLSSALTEYAEGKIKSDTVDGISKRLSDLGEKGDVGSVASAVYKTVTEQKLTNAEKKTLKNSAYAQRVVNEMTDMARTSSEWAQTLSDKNSSTANNRVNPDVDAYRNKASQVNTAAKDSAASESKTSESDNSATYGLENYERRVKEEIINEGQDVERFNSDFELFKMYGETGRSFEQAIAESTVSDDFTEIQMKTAYDIGVQKAKAHKIDVLKGVVDIEGGEIYVTDSKNNVRKFSEVNIDESTRKLYNAAAKYDVDTANVFVRGFNPSATLTSYTTAFNTFYSAGTAGKRSFSEVMKENSSLIRYMADKSYAKKAFEIGRQERVNADNSFVQKKQTGKFPATGEYQNKGVSVGEEAVDEFYNALSKKLGIDIVRTYRIETKNGQVPNAQYEPTRNKATISENAVNEWQANIHELTHAGVAYNSEKMKVVKKATIDWFISQYGEAEFENTLNKYKPSYKGLSRVRLEEEFFGDAIGGMFSTEEGVQQFLDWLQGESGYSKQEKKTILQRITEWLGDIIEAIRDIMNSGELNGVGKLFAKEQCDELTKIRQMFLEALDGYAENYREKGAVEGDVKFSVNENFNKQIDSWDRNTIGFSFIVGRTSNALLEAGIPEQQIRWDASKLKKTMEQHKAMTIDVIKQVPTLLENPIIVIDSKSDVNSRIVMGELYDNNGKIVTAVLKLNPSSKSGNQLDLIKISSTQGRGHIESLFKHENGKSVTVRYVDKKRIRSWLNVNRLQLPLHSFNLDSNNSISNFTENVKNSLTVNLDKSAELSKLETEKKKYDDEIFSLRRDFDKLKRTDEYERLETAVVEAQGKGEEFNAAIDEYNKWLKESGMGEINRKLTEAKTKAGELYKKIIRMQNDLHKEFMKSIESFDDETVDKYVNRAVRKFKTTSRFGLAGYITTTGSLLDFSEGQGYRVQDHREVKDILDMPNYAEYSDGMIAFMNMGNIRLQSYGIDISKMPNAKQIAVLRRFFNSLNGEVTVDLSLPDGHTAGSIEYPENTKADRILNDIKKYFETGVVPELSTVERFRYSLPLNDLNELHASNIEKVTELGKVAAQLTAHINYIGSSQTKRVLDTLSIHNIVRELKKEYRSKADIHEVTERVAELYELFNQGRVSQSVVKAHVDSIVDMIINESVYMKPEISDYSKEILKEIRRVKIKLSDTQKKQAAYHFGSYNEYRKSVMGSAVLSEEGTDLDERWQSLCEQYPGKFDKETVDTDQPYALYEVIKELRNTYEDESGLDIDSVKAQLSADICAGFVSIPTVAEHSNAYAVKEQELIESLKAEKQMYKKIYSESYQKAKAQYEGQLAHVKAEQAEEILRAKARMESRVQGIADTRLREKKRNRLIKNIKRLDRLLRMPGKGAPSAGTNKYGQDYVHLTNIPEDFKKAVIDFCYIFIENDAGVFTGKYKDSEAVARKKVFELMNQYKNLKKTDTYMNTVIVEDVEKKIEQAHEIVADKRLSQLSAAELDTLIDIADHLTTVINNEVEMWVDGKRTKVNDTGESAMTDLGSKGMKGHRGAFEGIDKIKALSLKPVYFFEQVGGTLEMLWNDILGGQDKYVRNMQFAQQRFDEIAKKYHLQKWMDDDAKTFKTSQGHEISLTRGQALLVWATWKRERVAGKDAKHLFEGGIVYPEAVKKASDKGKLKLPKVLEKVYEDGSAHRIREEDILKIDEWLTNEQKAYADELVAFLSSDIGAWGNEISMQLYGINKFNEKYYIPFNSAGNYLYKGMGEEGTRLLKSEGFTNETKWGANNPLVVDDFTQVAVKHIERMSMYNSMVIPLDNFSRVWNYQQRADAQSNESTKDVKAMFETAYGKEYRKYVDNLLRDINGGVMNDSRDIGDKWLSKFKKSAVMASASVMIQQPSAVGRAFSEIAPKYFVKSIGKNMLPKAYEECKKYAPVAVLKEIGGFDTVGGQSMTDWMLKKEYKGAEKLKAFFKDSQFRDDVISWGPAWADRITWAHIWLACKNEVRVKQNLTGEALLEAAGKRFTEVINKTQVYDSVLSRSDAMRDKSTYMKMATAFMGEPTTSLNMLGSAFRDLNTPKMRAKGIRKITAVATAQLLNSMLVSLVYAARDDDEEKGFWEVYLGEVFGNFFDDINPLTMIPFVKDVYSLFLGYSIERSDMTVISNFVDSVNAWRSEDKTIEEKIAGTVGSVADLFGIPLKNLIRDVRAVMNVYNKTKSESESTLYGAAVEVHDSVLEIADPLKLIDNSKDRRLYDAWVEGNEGFYNEYASKYKSGSSVKSALESQIEERYAEGKITYDEAFKQLRKLGYSENEAEYKIREIDDPVEEEEKEDKNADFFSYEGIESVQSTADAERQKKRDEAEAEDKEYSEDSDYTWLRAALENGDKSEIQKEIDYLKDNGVSESKINSAVKSWIKENDGSVINLAESYAAGDLTGFESKVSAIASKYGVEPSAVAGAVRSAAGYQSKEIDGTMYALSDLHISVQSGNSTQSKMIADAIIEAKTEQYIAEGETRAEAEKKARQSVKTSLSSTWKEVYQKADANTRAEIQRQLAATGAWKNRGDVFELTRKWRQEYIRGNQ